MPTQKSTLLESGATLLTSFLVLVALLVYFMPRESKFGYEYEQGRPWRYGSLIATFDFPIYKTQAEVEAGRDSALKNFMPFFSPVARTAKIAIANFRNDFVGGKFHDVPAKYLPHVEQLLEAVYEKGIVGAEDLSALTQNHTQGIRVVQGTEAETRPTSELFSTLSAYQYVMHADTLAFPRDIMARCNIHEYLEPNLFPDSAKTLAAREDVLSSVSPTAGMVQSGQRIIDRGEIISAEQYQILQSFQYETERRNDPSEGFWLILAGQMLFVSALLVAFFFYLNLFRRDYLRSPHSILLLSTLVGIFPILAYLMVTYNVFNVYVIPFAMVPIFIRIFLDSRTAFLAHVCATLLAAFVLRTNYEFIVIQTAAGMTAISALKDLSERSQLLRVALEVTVACGVTMLGYDLAQGIDFEHLDASLYISLAINGVLLLFAYPLLYLIEKLFGFTSGVTLIELSNTNNTILRRMSKVAQGTFIHSLQVANLAAEVADKIGAKPQLVRTGALYHDIGKLLAPAFFTENQSGVNPHDELSEEKSAAIIINHVKEGLRLAEKYHLPKVIRDFIATHHGLSQTKYFYIQWKNRHPGQEPDEGTFTYPGPNPFTREQAILMMCDAVEASSRSLKEVTEESLTQLVDRIVDSQVQAGYFKNCPITFRDITESKQVLVESLKTIYHTRIAYPELNKPAAPEPAPPRRKYFFGRNA